MQGTKGAVYDDKMWTLQRLKNDFAKQKGKVGEEKSGDAFACSTPLFSPLSFCERLILFSCFSLGVCLSAERSEGTRIKTSTRLNAKL